ncbi:hypothetical protein CC86DRAFT_376022 [Ophiobolus disseminans]|uniref:Uncharacterized protein n=1 Tax=Ophiobolus disseminans TaxID=1469910 RepID=A0A6A6ZBK4_9PLEO|nr:hypothetical protein CC86DRAFT_376022 [Ophiobolus disseminans]
MPAKNALTNIPYTLNDVKLGTLVPSVAKPNQDTMGPVRELKEGSDYRWRDQSNPKFEMTEERSGFLAAHLTRFFSASAASSDATSNSLESKECKIYELSQPKKLFSDLVAGEPTKKWLYRTQQEGEDIHFVVGYRTYLDATEASEETKDSSMETKATAPVSEMVADPTSASSQGGVLDTDVSASRTHHSNIKASASLPGERIFAISFRKVRFDWFSSKENPARLDKDNTWVITTRRGIGQHEDSIEVGLEDDISPEAVSGVHVNLGGPGGDEDYVTIEDDD